MKDYILSAIIIIGIFSTIAVMSTYINLKNRIKRVEEQEYVSSKTSVYNTPNTNTIMRFDARLWDGRTVEITMVLDDNFYETKRKIKERLSK